MKTIAFRFDGDENIGLGHASRTSSIAKEYSKLFREDKILVLTRTRNELLPFLSGYNFKIHDLKSNNEEELLDYISRNSLDLLFIDNPFDYSKHFGIQASKCLKLVFLHMWNNAVPYANAYFIPSAHNIIESNNKKILKENNINVFEGYKYVIINTVTKGLKRNKVDKRKNTIVITTGGSDPKGVIFYLINWLKTFTIDNWNIVFLEGRNFKHKSKLNNIQLPNDFSIVPYDSNHFVEAGIVISTFGVTTYELLFLGCPQISIGHAEQNALGSLILEQRTKAFIDVGLVDDIDASSFVTTLKELVENDIERLELSKKSYDLFDGNGAFRIAKKLNDLILD